MNYNTPPHQCSSIIPSGNGCSTSDLNRTVVSGKVVGGVQLGRKLGFPTANMATTLPATLPLGVYAVRFRDGNGNAYDGVVSFGRRPTVEAQGELLLETHVLDYAGDLYGQTCTVEFIRYVRPELKFKGLDALVERIHQDVAEVRGIFETLAGTAS